MKTFALAAALLFAITPAAYATADTPDLVATADLDLLARHLALPTIARGMTPQEVHEALGAPNAQLAPNVWVYWNFKAKDTPRGHRFDTALVIFTHDRVREIKLCDGKTVRAFIAQQEAKSPRAAVAAK